MKQRLDLILVERGLAPTRSVAQGLIMAGKVQSHTRVLDKPGQGFDADIELQIAEGSKYVSRGGDKLASVADGLGLSFDGKIVLDVGSSTGGFSDYALQNGAVKVYAVDVGTAQLAYKLRQDPRVVVMERTDIRDVVRAIPSSVIATPPGRVQQSNNPHRHAEFSSVSLDDGFNKQEILKRVQDDSGGMAQGDNVGGAVAPKELSDQPDIAVIDVSFISLIKILPSVVNLLKPGAPIVAMMKPQFETDKATADEYQGVIKDEIVRQQIISDFEAAIIPEFQIMAIADSAVHGAEGNRERFYLLKTQSSSDPRMRTDDDGGKEDLTISKPGYVYIMANERPTLYVGVTSDLVGRIYQHREGLVEGFTKRYDLKKLVYFEVADDIESAILREKHIKHWKREWKLKKIREMNPNTDDLYDSIV